MFFFLLKRAAHIKKFSHTFLKTFFLKLITLKGTSKKRYALFDLPWKNKKCVFLSNYQLNYILAETVPVVESPEQPWKSEKCF